MTPGASKCRVPVRVCPAFPGLWADSVVPPTVIFQEPDSGRRSPEGASPGGLPRLRLDLDGAVTAQVEPAAREDQVQRPGQAVAAPAQPALVVERGLIGRQLAL